MDKGTIRNIIFDFDGTLVDSAAGIIATEREVLRRLGLPQTSDEKIHSAIGLPLKEALHTGGDIPESILDEAADLYHSLFFEFGPDRIVPFEGVRETLDAISNRHIPMAIATSRGKESLNYLLESLKMTDYFTYKLTASDGIKPKPAPDMVLSILAANGWNPDETLVVGDTTFDIDMGRNASCRTLAVSYGNHTKEQLLTSHPDFLTSSFPFILKLL